MQISKSFLVVWATILCIVPQCVLAADTEAQVKAREALRKKIDELQPGSGETAPPAAVPDERKRPSVKSQPVPVKPRRPVPVTPAPTVIPAPAATPEVVAAPPADSEAVAKARDALHKKMDELQGQPVPDTKAANPPIVVKPRRPARVAPAPEFHTPPAKAPATPAFTAPPPLRVPTAPVVVPETPAPVTPAPAVAQPQTPPPVASAPVVVQPQITSPAPVQPQVVAQPQATSPSDDRWEAEQAAQKQAKQPKAPKKPNLKPATTAFRPIEGPPPNISADKQQRLAELLRRYQADEINPAQYHEERAKILAQP